MGEHETVVDARDLSTGLMVVSRAAASDTNRPILAAVRFEQSADALRRVGADNYRISMYDIPATGAELFGSGVQLRIADVRVLRHVIARLHEPLALTIVDNQLRVQWPYGAVQFRLMEGLYPSYHQVIRPQKPPTVSLDARLLAQCAAMFAKTHATSIDMEIDGPLVSVTLRSHGSRLVTVLMPVRHPVSERPSLPPGADTDAP